MYTCYVDLLLSPVVLFQANNAPVHLKRGMSDMLMYRGAMTLSFIGIGVSIYAIGCMANGTMKKKGD